MHQCEVGVVTRDKQEEPVPHVHVCWCWCCCSVCGLAEAACSVRLLSRTVIHLQAVLNY